jgi:hydroxyacylglutathione hydrolase
MESLPIAFDFMNTRRANVSQDHTTVLTCGDNYIYICPCGDDRAFVVDPTDAAMVLHALAERRWSLLAILLTHHHGDHTAGAGRLKSQTGAAIIGADERRISGLDRLVGDANRITLGDRTAQVLGTPGHTSTSVCYYLEPSSTGEPGVVFTGDTLFVGGCGRPMECEARILWKSLERLAALPDETLVYCGHDYTVENYEFARTIEPDNRAVQERLRETKQAAREGRPGVPSTIVQEKATNIFLRAGEPKVKAAVGMAQASADRVFAELRQRKNLFG